MRAGGFFGLRRGQARKSQRIPTTNAIHVSCMEPGRLGFGEHGGELAKLAFDAFEPMDFARDDDGQLLLCGVHDFSAVVFWFRSMGSDSAPIYRGLNL